MSTESKIWLIRVRSRVLWRMLLLRVPGSQEQLEDWPVTQANGLSLSECDQAPREMKSSFGATILTISGRKSGDQSDENLVLDPVFLRWEWPVNVMDRDISVARK